MPDRREYWKQYYQKNKKRYQPIRKKYAKHYREENRDKIKAQKWYANYKKRPKGLNKKYTVKLANCYVKQKIRRAFNLTKDEPISQELIEIWRARITLYRIMRDKNIYYNKYYKPTRKRVI